MSNLSQFAAGGDPQYWVSGTTYAIGKTVRSPTDHQRYVRVVAGAGTTDPANDATNWRPDGARAIKSIQRGFVNIGGGAAMLSTSATISAVNTAKAELRHLGHSASYTSVASSRFSLALTNSTTITATRTAGESGTGQLSWELTEYH